MPFTIFSILEMFNTASYATMDAQDLKGTSLVIDNFNSASLATIGHGDLFNTGKRNQGTLVSTTGSSVSPVKYYIYTQTSSGDTEFSGSEWTTLSNWAEILTSAAEFTASFVTSSDVYGPFGSNSILSASYAVSSSHALNTISSSFSLTSSYILANNIDQPFGNLEATGIFTLPDIPNVSESLAAALAGGDNLGNHTATTNLNLANNSIISASNISASGDITATNISASILRIGNPAHAGQLTFSQDSANSYQLISSIGTLFDFGSANVITTEQRINGTRGIFINAGTNGSSDQILFRDRDSNNIIRITESGSIDIGSISSDLSEINIFAPISSSYNISSSGTVVASSFTGSLLGTASTASFVTASNVHGPHGTNSIESASFALTSSYILSSISASYSETASQAISASYAETASYVLNAITASHALSVNTASYVDLSSGAQGQITVGGETTTINSLGVGNTPIFGNTEVAGLRATSYISSSGNLFASLSYDSTPITEEKGGVVVFDTASGQFFYTGSYGSTTNTVENANTASFVTASNVYGPYGSNSIISASYAVTSSHALNALTASHALETLTASHALNALTSSHALNTLTASHALNTLTASHALSTLTSSYVEVTSGTQGVITIGGESTTINSLGNGDTPTFGNTEVAGLRATSYVSASGKLFASLSFDNTPITSDKGGVVVFDTASGQFFYTGSYIGTTTTVENANTASFVTASNVHGPHGTSSIESASFAITSSHAASAVSASYIETASYALNALTASHALNALTASHTLDALTSSHALQALSSSYVDLSSGAQGEITVGGETTTINSLGVSGTPIFGNTEVEGLRATSYISASGKLFASLSFDNTPIASDKGGVVVFDTASGQFFYTGSYVGTTTTVENADTASFVTASNVHGPHGINSIESASFAITASYILNAVSASYIETASYALNALTASHALNSITASHALNSLTASHALVSNTASYVDITSDTQGVITIGGETTTINSLGTGNTPTFGNTEVAGLRATSYVSASGKLFASLSFDNTPIAPDKGGVVVFDTASGQFFYTGSYVGTTTTVENADTASFVTASNVYGPYGASSIESSSFAVTASYILNAVSASYIETASYALNSLTASHALSTLTASHALDALTSSHALSAITASYVDLSSGTQGVITVGGENTTITQLSNTGTPTFAEISATTGIDSDGYISASGKLIGDTLEISQSISSSFISASIISASKYYGLNANFEGILSLPDFPNVSSSLAQLISGGLTEIVQDATPQLGGNLDLNGQNISGSGNIDFTGNINATSIVNVNTTHVTASGNISASGNLLGGGITINGGNSTFNSDLTTLGADSGDRIIANAFFTSRIHTTNHITASGNISSSDTVHAKFLRLPQTAGNSGEGSIYFGSGPADNNGFIYGDGNTLHLGYNDGDKVSISDTGVLISPALNVEGNITSSGNISSSGQLSAATVTGFISSDGDNRILTSDGDGTFTAEGSLTYDGTTFSLQTQNIDMQAAGGGFNLIGHITASGDITASGAGKFNSVIVNAINDAGGSAFNIDTDGLAEFSSLDVSGNAFFDSDIQVGEKIIHRGDADTFIKFTNNQIVFDTQGGNAFKLDSNRNGTLFGNFIARDATTPSITIKNTNSSTKTIGDLINSLIFEGGTSGGTNYHPAIITANATDNHAGSSNTTAGTELRIRTTPAGTKGNILSLKINADSGSIFSGSVIADRFITTGDRRLEGTDAVKIIGENIHGNVESSTLLITGSVGGDGSWDVSLFETPVENHSVDFKASYKFTKEDGTIVVAEVIANAGWDSSETNFPNNGNYSFSGITQIDPGSYNLIQNSLIISNQRLGTTPIDNSKSNFTIIGPTNNRAIIKWVPSAQYGGITTLANAKYEIVIKYDVYKF